MKWGQGGSPWGRGGRTGSFRRKLRGTGPPRHGNGTAMTAGRRGRRERAGQRRISALGRSRPRSTTGEAPGNALPRPAGARAGSWLWDRMAAEVLPEFHCVARRGEGAKSTPSRDCDILQIFWVVFFFGFGDFLGMGLCFKRHAPLHVPARLETRHSGIERGFLRPSTSGAYIGPGGKSHTHAAFEHVARACALRMHTFKGTEMHYRADQSRPRGQHTKCQLKQQS